ncbi:MAG: RidA family protein [Deltaproteobacteria bacterium]|nr:RidA family protein [Deltaproteobacteria bacterium]
MEKEIITPKNVAKPAAPYGSAVKVKSTGSLIFVAGVLSCDIDGNVIYKGDILEQTRQTVKNLIATLEAAGTRPENVVKTTTYVVSSVMKDFFETKSFLEALTPFNRPADTLVGVASLAGSEQGQLIEIDAIAVAD